MSTDESPEDLKWTASFKIAGPLPSSRQHLLTGDKILLPPSALEQLLAAAPLQESSSSTNGPLTTTFDPFNPYTYGAERYARDQQRESYRQLPHPLTFRLVNPENGRVVFAGIREFSAEDDEIILSNWLRQSLGLGDASIPQHDIQNGISEDTIMTEEVDAPRITVHARQLPKGTFVKLRPLEAGYDADDWKALLEQYLRHNFTTLTKGEVLSVSGGRGIGKPSETFKFLVDEFKPEGEGICVVDTDLEVDIEALNEEQARETVKRIAEKSLIAPGTARGSSPGGRIDLFSTQTGQVVPGDWIDYTLPSWDRAQGIEFELSGVDDNCEVDLYVNPLAPRQRAKPRNDEFVFEATTGKYPRRIKIQPTNTELEDASEICISIFAYKSDTVPSEQPVTFSLSVQPFRASSITSNTAPTQDENPPNPDESRCKNCQQWIPSRSLVLHENFCYRNNILCPKGCGQVFQQRSPEWDAHWHCPKDDAYGNTHLSEEKHTYNSHTQATCNSCERTYSSQVLLAKHKTTVCPGKLILCQFCHLQVPQEGDPDEPNPEAILSGLTPHELADGARTTDCHLCSKIVRLRDMRTHLAHHELQKTSRAAPVPCRNILCGRTVHGTALQGGNTRVTHNINNEIGLCGRCFGPLYVAIHDPEGKALKRRIERRYLTQLLTGCGKTWCQNKFCRAGRKHLELPEQGTSTKEALPMIKPELVGLDGLVSPLHFCVDETAQKSRVIAEHIAAEGIYSEEWCVGALEATNGDVGAAREWLSNWAPKKST